MSHTRKNGLGPPASTKEKDAPSPGPEQPTQLDLRAPDQTAVVAATSAATKKTIYDGDSPERDPAALRTGDYSVFYKVAARQALTLVEGVSREQPPYQSPRHSSEVVTRLSQAPYTAQATTPRSGGVAPAQAHGILPKSTPSAPTNGSKCGGGTPRLMLASANPILVVAGALLVVLVSALWTYVLTH